MRSHEKKAGKSISARLNLFTFLLFSVAGFIGLYVLQGPRTSNVVDWFGLFSIGVIGCCRWTLFALRIVRSRIYLHWVFPRWRRRANQIPVEQLPHICLIVPTYKEKPWITERVFRAIAQEAKSLHQPVTLVVNSSSNQENADILAVLKSEDPDLASIRLIQMVQKDGKRKAMADALREVAKLSLPPDTVIALMDGDSELAPGTLRQCLPFFRLFPKMGALTTDELPIVEGSHVFSEWFHLRFAQRHYQMCSDSLGSKVMCLTGRFSLFRAEAALSPSFAEQLERDTLDDWLWGRFTFLSGDDKSTWFWLLKRRYDMLYIPDAMVYSIETISGSVTERAYQNMRRWYGNMLRNSSRAIALGPRVTGWFIWYNLIDQRISIWTSLLTPGFLLISLMQGNWLAAGIIISWIFFSRPIMLMFVFWGRDSYLKPIHLPLLLLSQWSSSLIKIWTQMNLATQSWANRGIQAGNEAMGKGVERHVKLSTSSFLLISQSFSFVVFLCWMSGVLNPVWDISGIWLSTQPDAHAQPLQVIVAEQRGVKPSDGQDDAAVLQSLIDHLPANQSAVEIVLPIGEIDLQQPIEIRRSHLSIKGQGASRTVLQAHFNQKAGNAVIAVSPLQRGQSGDRQLQKISLSGFSVQQMVPANQSEAGYRVNGIALEKVEKISLRNLNLEGSGGKPLVMSQTQDVTLENVAMQDGGDRTRLVQNFDNQS